MAMGGTLAQALARLTSSQKRQHMEALCGVGVSSGSFACEAALKAFGVSRIAVLSPYAAIGDVEVTRFFSEAGFTVVRFKGLRCPTPISIAEVGDVDCNGNFSPDDADILFGDSLDLDGNGVPDECQSPDCDEDGRPDRVEILLAPWLDCNDDGLLDACAAVDAPRSDCNGNLLDDECESPDAQGFLGTYFTGQDLVTPIASRIADSVDFDIGGMEPWPGAGFTDFAARCGH